MGENVSFDIVGATRNRLETAKRKGVCSRQGEVGPGRNISKDVSTRALGAQTTNCKSVDTT